MIMHIPLSSLTFQSYPPQKIISLSEKQTFFWSDFIFHVSLLRSYIGNRDESRWIINSENGYLFLCALTAALQCGKPALLCANLSSAFLGEIVDSRTGFLCDQPMDGAVPIQEIVAGQIQSSDADLSFPAVSAENSAIILYTSGSTGSPKAFKKRLSELEAETGELAKIWGSEMAGRTVYSMVNHHHIYGLLFSILLPVSLGLPFQAGQIHYPESLESLSSSFPLLVCSPAILKRMAETAFVPGIFGGTALIFSSGGILPAPVAEKIAARFGSGFWEIYGSTETGGIAFRKAAADAAWRPFPRNSVSTDAEGRLLVRSPYILDPAGFLTGDLARFIDDGHFILEGRVDSIVKIEEKRISLTEVENRLRESEYAADAHVIALSGKRQYLGAVIALNQRGIDFFSGKEKLFWNAFFAEHLARFLERTVVPKKWRFVPAIPVNSQGKIPRNEIEALFRKTKDVDVSSVTIEGNRVSIALTVRSTSVYFDGHFPSFKLLPGVVQFDLAMRLGAEHLGIGQKIKTITRVKFRKPIQPDILIALDLEYFAEASKLNFSYSDKLTKAVYSSGSIILEAI